MAAAILAIQRGEGLGDVLIEYEVGHWLDQALLSELESRLQADSRQANTRAGTERLHARLENLRLAQDPSED